MPGQITGLVIQKRNKERVNVFVDGEFAFGLAMIEALKLHKGQHLSDEEIAQLKALDELEVAHERALNYLSYRPRSTAEVRKNLSEKGFSESSIDRVIERLKRARLIDDRAFANYWRDNRQQFKPRSARALQYELRQKGIDDTVITETLNDLDEDEAAYQAAHKRASRYRDLERQSFRKRLGDFLARNGFSYETIREVVDRLWKEQHEETQGFTDEKIPDID